MKFTCTTEINAPINKVAELYADKNYFKDWQEGFVSIEHRSGIEGKAGAKSNIIYTSGNHIIDLTETIMVNNLPREFTALYEHKNMTNTMYTRFIALNHLQTKMVTEISYISFHGFLPKIMAYLMPGIFKKQTRKWLSRFKSFVENQRFIPSASFS